MPEPNLDRWAREVEEKSRGSVWMGLGFTFAVHLFLLVCALFILGSLYDDERGLELIAYPVKYFGLTQLVYMIPAILLCRRRGSTETVKGLIIGASLTFLLNAACNGLLFYG